MDWLFGHHDFVDHHHDPGGFEYGQLHPPASDAALGKGVEFIEHRANDMISDPYDIAAGREIANNIINEMNHDLHGAPLQQHHEAQDAAHRHLMAQIHAEPLFGATKCGHCSDGITTYPDGRHEVCKYCGGVGYT
jgi:hypothetical protein